MKFSAVRLTCSPACPLTLQHQDTLELRAAYHRGAYWKERVAMAQWWSDHLDLLRQGAKVIPFAATNFATSPVAPTGLPVDG